MKAVVEVRELRKSFGDVHAVDGVDLSIEQGEIFALLGPNGAGRTTLVEILEGFGDRDSGDVSVLGHDPAAGELALEETVGIVSQSTAVDPYLTVPEMVDMIGGCYADPRPTREVLDAVRLGRPDVRVRSLSGGQQRRPDVVLVLGGWAVVAVVLAARFFSWQPRS